MSRNHNASGFWQSAGRILISVARPLLPALPELDATDRQEVERDLEEFLVGEIRAMPSYLRVPYVLALFAFQGLPLAYRGRPYTALRPAVQQKIVRGWSMSRLAPKRDFVKLIRTCTLFYYLDHSLVRAQLEPDVDNSSTQLERAHGQ